MSKKQKKVLVRIIVALVRIGHGEAQLHGGHATGHASVCNLGSLLHRLRTDHSHDPNIFNFVQIRRWLNGNQSKRTISQHIRYWPKC